MRISVILTTQEKPAIYRNAHAPVIMEDNYCFRIDEARFIIPLRNVIEIKESKDE